MDDVTRALERAADAVGSANIDEDWGDIARAAVLAFLKAMPDQSPSPPPLRSMVLWYPSAIAAAVEALDGEVGVVEVVNQMPSTFPDYDEYTLDGVAWHRAYADVIRCTRAQARHCAFRRVVRPLHVAREQDGRLAPDAQKAPPPPEE